MIKVDDARKIISRNISILKHEKAGLLSAMGRILAEDIKAGIDLPLFDNSAMDGYAVKASDTKKISNRAPVLRVTGCVPAGQMPRIAVKNGTAVKIMTGAPAPKGTEAVVVVEASRESIINGVRVVELFQQAEKGENIRKKGEDIKKGSIVLRRGLEIRAQEIALLAALNQKEIKVIKIPRVAVIATGSELVEAGKKLGPGQIVNSNTFSMAALCAKYGAKPLVMGIAKDDVNSIKKAVLKSVSKKSGCHALVITGGVSMGDYDIVNEVLRKFGMKAIFWKVAMKPGKPVLFGKLMGRPVFGLPGNPASAMVGFEQFVGPALLAMQGKADYSIRKITALALHNIRKTKGKRYFLRGRILERGKKRYVGLSGGQSSGMLYSMAKSNCLIEVPEKTGLIRKGSPVKVQMVDIIERGAG